MAMLEAALAYVDQGFKIMPVKLDKTPFTAHGLKDATELQIVVKEYWGRWPDAGIGILTDGLVVLDFDKKSGGYKAKKELEGKYGQLPATRTHRTGGGGLHYIYRNPNGYHIRNTVALGGYTGLDVRANGGYIVAPPSPHASGKNYQVVDPADIADCPQWLILLTATSRPQTVNPETLEGLPIPETQRNVTLSSLAGTMRRRGLPEEAIEAALLITNQKRCLPPLEDKEVIRISHSISRYPPETEDAIENWTNDAKTDNLDISFASGQSDKKLDNSDNMDKTNNPPWERRSRIIRKMVDEWLSDHKGETFDLDTICRQLDIKIRDDRHTVIKKLHYEIDAKKLEMSDFKRGLYTYIDKTFVSIDWVNASPLTTIPIKWPIGEDESHFGFADNVCISPGDIVVIAGVSNMGKTAICLNLLWDNMDIRHCTLMGNEYSGGKFKRRTTNMTWANPLKEDGTPKFDLIERHDRWKDIIKPDDINIIDWINLADNFYQIGSIIEGIQSKLRNGIAVISLQKSDQKSLGLGGGFSLHLASLYLAIDFERLTVVKAKEWYGVNPNGKMYGFSIGGAGTHFSNIREIKACRPCGGTGHAKGGDCQNCYGKGYIDVV